MILKSLNIINFRNYKNLNIDFKPGINHLVGSNGQGKTNILEAIYYLSLLKSFRTNKQELLKNLENKSQGFSIEGIFADNEGNTRKIKIINSESRKLLCDNSIIEKAIDFINSFICIAFVPEDIEIINGDAQARRQFIDIFLCQTKPIYLYKLQQYNITLKNRNAILKMGQEVNYKLLQTYNNLLAENAATIFYLRNQVVNEFKEQLDKISPLFFHDGQMISINYLPKIGKKDNDLLDEEVIKDLFLQEIKNNINKDIEYGYTTIGPHRDDFSITLNNKPTINFGSAGEQRISALALRLASLQLLYKNPDQYRSVILLLDDVFGELDDQRRKDFLSALANNQIFIAGTSLLPELEKTANVINVIAGQCVKI